MLDELKEEKIVNKLGGRFKLSTLIQKRMAAVNAGARTLVDKRSKDHMAIVLQEILEDKIYLDATGQGRHAVSASHEKGNAGLTRSAAPVMEE